MDILREIYSFLIFVLSKTKKDEFLKYTYVPQGKKIKITKLNKELVIKLKVKKRAIRKKTSLQIQLSKLMFKISFGLSPSGRMSSYLTDHDWIGIISRLIARVFQIARKIILQAFFYLKQVIGFVLRQRKVLNWLAKIPSRLKRKKHREKKKKVYELTFFHGLKLFFSGMVFSFLFVFLPLLIVIFASQLPNPYDLSVNSIPKTTKIYDRNMNLLYEIYANRNRTIVKLQDVPLNLINATIAIEDRDFYKHPGFDVKGMIRAAWNNLRTGELQGGSTITQQLIKSAFLNPQPTVTRKLKEILLAFLAERVYSKPKILELYFNYVPYGGTAWGVEAASEIYFGKEVGDLDLSESAFLAGVTRAPSVLSPYNGNSNAWKKRQKEVLDAMTKEGYISEKQAEEAYGRNLVFNNPQVPIKAPHFVMYIKNLLIQKYGLNEVEQGGLKVVTTLDLGIQDFAEKAVASEVENDAYLNIKNGAALVTDPGNGDILAMVGNHNYFDAENGGNVNIATSLRQPGSSIKVVTYSLALSSGFTETSILDDSPLVVSLPGGNYVPVNYDGKFHGKLPLRLAFANSLNIPAVRVAQKLGVGNIVNFGKTIGIESWENSNKYGLSITLGAAEVTMIDMARVYGTIANLGKAIDLDPFIQISNSEGNIIYRKSPLAKEVLDSGIAFIVSDILADNKARSMEFGLFSPLKIEGHRVSVKTGTSDNKRDNWTDGFTKDYVVITWVGNNDNTPMSQNLASGITGAASIWNKIMVFLLQDKPDGPLVVPDNIVKKTCYGYEAYFVKGTEKSSCNYITPVPTATLLNYNIVQPSISIANPPVAQLVNNIIPTVSSISQQISLPTITQNNDNSQPKSRGRANKRKK